MSTRKLVFLLTTAVSLSAFAGCEWQFGGETQVDPPVCGASPDDGGWSYADCPPTPTPDDPPIPPNPGAECAANTDCASGYICDASSGVATCVATETCDTPADCDAGFWCDPRNTCVYTGQCSAEAPACTAGPGLYCNEDRNTCEPNAPGSVACADLIDEVQCAERADCVPVYEGINCDDPTGASCSANAANCTCESFVFDFCLAAD